MFEKYFSLLLFNLFIYIMLINTKIPFLSLELKEIFLNRPYPLVPSYTINANNFDTFNFYCTRQFLLLVLDHLNARSFLLPFPICSHVFFNILLFFVDFLLISPNINGLHPKKGFMDKCNTHSKQVQ